MSLTGPVTLALVAALCAAALAGTLLVCRRAARRPRGWLLVVPAVLGCQLCAVALAGVIFNDHYGFYTSWREPLGLEVHTVRVPPTPPGAQDEWMRPRVIRAGHSGHGTLLTVSVSGRESGVPAHPALVYLPPQYADERYRHRMFPVVEMLAGAGGGPNTWQSELDVAKTLDDGLARGTTIPIIAVMPTVTVDPPRDTECVDVSDGPSVETYLVRDVRATILHDFRADRTAAGWALLGYSTGGYCATNLTLRNPDWFAAGVSMSGYAKPYLDATTGQLFGRRSDLRDQNTPLWRLQHLPPPAVRLLLMTSKDDPQSRRDSDALAAATHPPLRTDLLTLPSAGHNFSVWRAEEPTAFAWLSRVLAPPLTAIPTVDGRSPGPVGD
jgi:enterochelin esterase-like enzyme